MTVRELIAALEHCEPDAVLSIDLSGVDDCEVDTRRSFAVGGMDIEDSANPVIEAIYSHQAQKDVR